MNKKDRFHFEILKSSALRGLNGFERIALSFDFDENQIDILCKIFNDFDRRKQFSYSELESELSDALKLHYQDVKGIINYLYDDNRYIEVITQFIKSLEEHNMISVEYHSIADDIKSKK